GGFTLRGKLCGEPLGRCAEQRSGGNLVLAGTHEVAEQQCRIDRVPADKGGDDGQMLGLDQAHLARTACGRARDGGGLAVAVQPARLDGGGSVYRKDLGAATGAKIDGLDAARVRKACAKLAQRELVLTVGVEVDHRSPAIIPA